MLLFNSKNENFKSRAVSAVLLFAAVILGCYPFAFGRTLYNPEEHGRKVRSTSPFLDFRTHDVGKIGLTITNIGQIGTGFFPGSTGSAPSCIYPYPGLASYLFGGAIWIGAVVGDDTLVTVGADGWQFINEMWPDPGPEEPPNGGAIIYRSTNNPDDYDAVSEQDFIAVYTDTLTDPSYVGLDPTDGRPHMPLDIKVVQKSYAWSQSDRDDFVLFDYSVMNIGQNTLNKVYMGIYIDGDVMRTGDAVGFQDDIAGFKRTDAIQAGPGCEFRDTVNIAWIADNNGRSDYDPCPYTSNSLTSVTGVRILQTPSDSLKYSFNWWVSNGDTSLDFGPRLAGTPDDPFRDFGGNLGTPSGDKNKYYILSHEEFDYDQLFTALDHSAEGWLPPPSIAADLADGYDTRYLLSFGPFDIQPGEILPIVFAYVAGEDFHTDCGAWQNLYDPADPEPYYDQLNFDHLIWNARFASNTYDIWGFDTDGDGYAGKYIVCPYDSIMVVDTVQVSPLIVDTFYEYTSADTFYYEGDGVSDLVPAGTEPPLPSLRLISVPGKLVVRWNGRDAETSWDDVNDRFDFEGYHVYLATIDDPSDFALISAYDIEDYWKYIYNSDLMSWECLEMPFTLGTLRDLYGSGLDPLEYDNPANPMSWMDSLFYFTKVGDNHSDLSDTALIHKCYPSQLPPTTLDRDSAALYFSGDLTMDGFFKYYEYEYIFENLTPGILYYIKVTSTHVTGLFQFDERVVLGSPDSAYIIETEAHSDDAAELPSQFSLYQNYPNPFNPATTVMFDLPSRSRVKLTIYNILGEAVRRMDLGEKPAGRHSVVWNGSDDNNRPLPSGLYLYKIESGDLSAARKMILLK
jgi:hypothetical protein